MPLADRALVVGINRYPELGKLSGAEHDAKAFYQWVTSAGGVAKKNAALIVSSKYKKAARWRDEQPTREAIEDFFYDVVDASKANNAKGEGLQVGKRLYMFFSGHGFSPTLDESGVLMANASRDAIQAFAARSWANQIYEYGLFDEVLLFQDACREVMEEGQLSPPFLPKNKLPGLENRRRFAAFSAKNPQLSIEKKMNGKVRGVFSVTLLEGLSGGARDPQTGEITAGLLKAYLQSNMKSLLSDDELEDDEIAKVPEVDDRDPLVILGPPPGWTVAKAEEYPVTVNLQGPRDARVSDGQKDRIVQAAAPDPWQIMLPRGYYKVIAGALQSELFEVTGALLPDGSKEVKAVDVH